MLLPFISGCFLCQQMSLNGIRHLYLTVFLAAYEVIAFRLNINVASSKNLEFITHTNQPVILQRSGPRRNNPVDKKKVSTPQINQCFISEAKTVVTIQLCCFWKRRPRRISLEKAIIQATWMLPCHCLCTIWL